MERDAFSMEISDLEVEKDYFIDIGSFVGKVSDNILTLSTLPFVFHPLNCSLIIDQPKSTKAYLGSYWKKVYDKFDQDKKNRVNKKTDEIFQTKTKITRNLSWQNDRFLIRQKLRIRDCVTQNLFLADKFSFAYEPSEREMDSIRVCAEESSKIHFFNNQVCRSTFDIFRQHLKADIERETSFFSTLLKYFVMTACFFLINAALPLVATHAAGLLSKELTKQAASENLFVITLNDSVKKLIEDKLDNIDVPKPPDPYQPKKFQGKPVSLTDYLIKMGINIDMNAIIEEENELNRVKGVLISKMKENSTDEKKKQSTIDEYLRTARKHYEEMVNNKANFYIGQLGLLFVNWINGSFDLKHLTHVSPSPFYRKDRLYIHRDKIHIDGYDGLVKIYFPKIEQTYKEIYQNGSPLLFDQGSVKVDVFCPLSENVTKGLQTIIETAEKFKIPAVWNNPFDMPTSKMLHLKFKDGIEIMILLRIAMSGKFNNYVPEYFFRDISQFAALPTTKSPYPTFENLFFKPMGNLPTNKYKILKSFFSSLTVNPALLNFQLPLGENSLTTVKSATRDALMSKNIKLK